QAEDGIRDRTVTGVQTCALPILPSFQVPLEMFEVPNCELLEPVTLSPSSFNESVNGKGWPPASATASQSPEISSATTFRNSIARSEERRVGKEGESRVAAWE